MQPIVIRAREIDDNDLLKMLNAASALGDTDDFFGNFEYFNRADPFITLLRGEALLSKCQQLAPQIYAKLRKGTPLYWLAWATFVCHDYETFTFYLDAAVSDDLSAADRLGRDRATFSQSRAFVFFAR